MFLILILISQFFIEIKTLSSPKSKISVTTASKPAGIPCSHFAPGTLIFENNFDTFDFITWSHALSLSGSGTFDFQWFNNNRSNSFVRNGILSIRPTLLADIYGEDFLTKGSLNLHGASPNTLCTAPFFYGCEREGNPGKILNPIVSARLSTANSFTFKYAKIEVRAKMPTGDWLAPAIWLFPANAEYGPYPVSGVIKMAEGRGNENLTRNGTNIGSEQINHSLVYAPFPGFLSKFSVDFLSQNNRKPGWNKAFHKYQMEWTPEHFLFSIDGVITAKVEAGEGFFERGKFGKIFPGIDNPWIDGSKMAPYDKEYFLGIDLEVGGTARFPDDVENLSGKKPWSNKSPSKSATDFWNGKKHWLPTWKLEDKSHSAFQIDYVRIWAI